MAVRYNCWTLSAADCVHGSRQTSQLLVQAAGDLETAECNQMRKTCKLAEEHPTNLINTELDTGTAPGISVQVTAVSATGMRSRAARNSSSTSKHQRCSRWFGNSACAALLVKSCGQDPQLAHPVPAVLWCWHASRMASLQLRVAELLHPRPTAWGPAELGRD